jgi:hypothetical protein
MLFEEKWMELEIITLSEISQTQKENCHVFSHMCNLNLKKKNKKQDMSVKGLLFEEEPTGGRG